MGRMFNQPLPITSPPYLPTLYSKQEHYLPDALGDVVFSQHIHNLELGSRKRFMQKLCNEKASVTL